MRPSRFDGAHGIAEHTPIVISLIAHDTARHETGMLRRGACGFNVWRVTGAAPTALSARIHNEIRVPDIRPQQPIVRVSASAAVADIVHNTWQRTGTLCGQY